MSKKVDRKIKITNRFETLIDLHAFSDDAKNRLVYGKNDALFGAIETQQGEQNFGNFLDAGTVLVSQPVSIEIIGLRL